MDYFPQNPNTKSNQLLKSPLTSPPPPPPPLATIDMDITTTATATTTPSTIKTPESDSETPARVPPTKPLFFTNGLLKRHHSIHHHHHHNPPPIVLIYKECLKNHAASLGGHALDGCGEFMPSPSATRTDPTSLKCAACGCHRNFHRREPEDPLPLAPNNAVVEYQPHHRHRPPPPRGGSPSSPSPPPISSSYPASAPHMLLALSAGLPGPQLENNPTVGHATAPIAAHPNGRKRFRTKFTQNQKDKMFEFSERVGWKIQKRDEAAIAEICSEIGVDRGVLKVWMHNNKSTFGKRDNIDNTNGGTTTYNNDTNHANNGGSGSRGNTCQPQDHHHLHHNNDNVSPSDRVVVTNGSGSSSSS